MGIARKLRAWLGELWRRQRITRLGFAFSAASALVALAAFGSANNLLFLILAAMVAALLVSGLISRLSLAGLELDFTLPEHLFASERLTGTLLVRNLKRWMPSFSIHVTGSPDTGLAVPVYFPALPGGAQLHANVALFFSRRGLYRDSSFRFATRFPFGFTERSTRVTLPREVIVYPCITEESQLPLLLSIEQELASMKRGMGQDFYRVRPYEALESARSVDWRATAHTGELQVREYAQEEDQALAIYLDLSPAPEDWFERAVSCCAWLAWNSARRGRKLLFVTQEFSCYLPEEADVYAILKYLALVVHRPTWPLPASHDANRLHIVFSASPSRILETGWQSALDHVRVVGLDDLSPSATSTAGS